MKNDIAKNNRNNEKENSISINVNTDTFEYTYSAMQQEEIEKIRKKYLPKAPDKMEQLRKLDNDVTRTGTVWGLVLGILGCLMFGVGMCCTLVWADKFLVLGIVIGVIGMTAMGAAYPVYKKITEKQREKIAPQILALTEELMK